MPAKSVRVRVCGRVQGVSFRWFVAQRARELGLLGWVRNLPDGSVELVASGTPEAIDDLVEAVHQGPPAARVETVDVAPSPPPEVDGFAIRP